MLTIPRITKRAFHHPPPAIGDKEVPRPLSFFWKMRLQSIFFVVLAPGCGCPVRIVGLIK